jgi:hypothetical protein
MQTMPVPVEQENNKDLGELEAAIASLLRDNFDTTGADALASEIVGLFRSWLVRARSQEIERQR